MQTVAMRTLCDHCLNMPVAVTGAQGHPYLRVEGNYVEQANGKLERKECCTICKTVWLHRTGKWGNCEGYRLAP